MHHVPWLAEVSQPSIFNVTLLFPRAGAGVVLASGLFSGRARFGDPLR